MLSSLFLPLPESPAGFEELKNSGSYFVDKTEYIKTVFTDSATVLLFTRPRRFGKTLLMTMFESFLKINKDKPFDTSLQKKYFKGTRILEDTEFCKKFMGQYPVIEISLKDVDGKTYDDAYKMFASTVSSVASKFKYLLDSNRLDEKEKDGISRISDIAFLREQENSDYLKNSLRILASALYREYGKYPVLLIDEYDVPLANASYHDTTNKKLYSNDKSFVADYHENMVTLIKGFFGILKDKNTLTRTVLTGCLKVAKNSLFTGVNNFSVNSVTDNERKYTGIIGFTKEETQKFLKDYELDDYATIVKEHYDGYRFFDKEMFCPWDVVKFVRKNFDFKQNRELQKIVAGNYWAGSTSDKSLSDYIGYLTDKDNQRMQDLIDGKSISFKLNESMNYDTLSEHNSDDFWSLLMHTGYLTVDFEKTDENELTKDSSSDKNIFARIPNLKIKECFTNNIQNRFNTEVVPNNTADTLANSLFEGKADTASDTIFELLQSYISIRDTATKAPFENYYLGFLNGLFSNCSKGFFSEYHSNCEAGDGYADIVFKSKREDKAVIIEIKAASAGADLITLSENAVAQIDRKNYAEPFVQSRMISSIYTYGIAFSGKNCFITCKKIK